MVLHKPVGRREFLKQSAAGLASLGALTAAPSGFTAAHPGGAPPAAVPDKLVVLTFDDAVKSHRTVVAPLLKELGFGATFFVSHAWMNDHENFMTWKEIAELHAQGFEIGNHTWTHDNFSIPRNAARLDGELALVDNQLSQVGVPRPVNFAHPGNCFGPESIQTLMDLGYQLARRGINPEVEYGKVQVGPTFDRTKHHPLLIPTTGDAYPNWTFEHFQRVVAQARDGKVAVLQFHGVPDLAHPWVHTPPERFREYMTFLKEKGFRVIALRDLKPYIDFSKLPDDPLLRSRVPDRKEGSVPLPVEVEATRADLRYWLENMLRYHRYTLAEVALVTGFTEAEVQKQASNLGLDPSNLPAPEKTDQIRVLPYPGGRHPRVGFLEGAIDPMRGTKASIFLPWDPGAYVVVDLPEAVFSNLGLIFLAHTHIPTVWNEQNLVMENVDWQRHADGSLSFKRHLPNFAFTLGASIRPVEKHAEMELWLQNFSAQPLTDLRTQVCVMLKGAPGFNQQIDSNKILRSPVVATRSESGNCWILTAWERCGHTWQNPPVPCMHSDPILPDCPPAGTVRVRGRLWFYEGDDVEAEVARGKGLL
jgi:peptidoglycan/xylan/chitin deacetylase (PgdA/CDA1 family)